MTVLMNIEIFIIILTLYLLRKSQALYTDNQSVRDHEEEVILIKVMLS